MFLRRRIVTMLLVAAMVAGGLVFGVSAAILSNDFNDLEKQDAESKVALLEAQLNQDVVEMEATVTEFVQIAQILIAAPNTTNTENLTLQLVTANRVDAFAFVVQGQVIGQEINLTTGAMYNSTRPVFGTLANSSLIDVGPFDGPSAGFLQGEVRYLAAAKTLQLGNQSFALVVLREMDESFLRHMETQIGHLPVWVDEARSGVVTDGDRLLGFLPVENAEGESIGALRMTMDRDISKGGWQSLLFLLGSILLITVAFVLISVWLVNKFVLKRIRTAHEDMQHIAHARDWTRRMDLGGDDEIQGMALQFNHLMAKLQAQETEILGANARLERYARALSHDLRSPLSTLTLNLHLLSLRDQGEEIPKMQRTVHRIDEQIGQLLEDAVRHAAGETDANRVVADLAEDLQADMEAHHATLDVAPLPTVPLGLAPLRSVLQNLLTNAMKSGHGEPVHIAVTGGNYSEGSFLSIRDNGVGMDAETLARVQQEFHGDGYGIGLANCQNIMEKVGKMEFSSEPGKGTEVTLWFYAAS